MGKRLGAGLLCLLLFGGCGGKDMYYVETIGEVAGIGNEAQAYAEDKTRKKDAEYENLEAASSISGEYYYEEGRVSSHRQFRSGNNDPSSRSPSLPKIPFHDKI